MQVVFISNTFNHHQAPFCEAMHSLVDGNFYFISTKPMSLERKKMGWDFLSVPRYVIKMYDNDVSYYKCKRLIDNADIVISSLVYNTLLYKRLKDGKLTFKYSERLLKKTSFFRYLGYTLRTLFVNRCDPNLYLLCSSAFASSDYSKMFSFRNKSFKWGYFPEVKNYCDIDYMISHKKNNSILWVARLIPLKHPEFPILIGKRLKENRIDFSMNIIGAGCMEHSLKCLIEENGLENEIHLLGSMSPKEVRSYMELSEIFLFTSDRNEGWGAVLNESMNCGCAVVASHAIGSVPFLLKSSYNGLVFRDGDLEDLFHKTVWLLSHKAERIAMSKNAYLTMVNLWNAETASKRFLVLVKHLMNHESTPFKDGPCSKAEILSDSWIDN